MTAFDLSPAGARARDAADPLAPFRAGFYPPEGAAIYLDGNSLGLLSREAEASVRRALEAWKTRAIGGWLEAGWFTLAETLAARLAPLIGAEPDEVAVANSTTVNLHQLLATLYEPAGGRTRIVAFAGEFPSDLYALQSHLRLRGLDPAEHLQLLPASAADRLLDEAAAARALANPRVQLAVLPGVVFTTGQLLDIGFLCAEARRRGVRIGFDLSHSIGVVPHALSAAGADFAFWCHYKYLNAGPGAVGGLYLNRRHFGRAPGLAGWWGADKARQFAMAPVLTPAAGAGALQIGTPPVLSLAALDGALAAAEAAGIARLREKSLALTDYLIKLAEAMLPADAGFSIATPRSRERRGGHVAFVHRDAARLTRALQAAGVIADCRPPDLLRLAPAPLYNSFADCHIAMTKLGAIAAAHGHENFAGGNPSAR